MAVKKNNDWAEAVPASDDYYSRQDTPQKLFDITCTVGTVWAGGDENPRHVAFKMIADHSEGNFGTYSFPNQDGTTTTVTVDTTKS